MIPEHTVDPLAPATPGVIFRAPSIGPDEIVDEPTVWPLAADPGSALNLSSIPNCDEVQGNSVQPTLGESQLPERKSLIAASVKSAPLRELGFGMFIVQERVGMEGVLFNIYKIKTMDRDREVPMERIAEAELQGPGGKIEQDPRVTKIGQLLRRYWIDEVPQLLNILCGDMKLVGVRPLVRQEFELLPERLRNLRHSCRPGLMGIIFAEEVRGSDERVAAEERYLESWQSSPLWTDVRYFFAVCWGILVKGRRGS